MTDYCTTTLIAYGTTTDIDKFLFDMGEENGGLDFNRIIPEPSKVIFMVSAWLPWKHDSRNQFRSRINWRVANWSTKWNPIDVPGKTGIPDRQIDYYHHKNTQGKTTKLVTYMYKTPWNPGSNIMDALARKYSDVNFLLLSEVTYVEYYLAGMRFRHKPEFGCQRFLMSEGDVLGDPESEGITEDFLEDIQSDEVLGFAFETLKKYHPWGRHISEMQKNLR